MNLINVDRKNIILYINEEVDMSSTINVNLLNAIRVASVIRVGERLRIK